MREGPYIGKDDGGVNRLPLNAHDHTICESIVESGSS